MRLLGMTQHTAKKHNECDPARVTDQGGLALSRESGWLSVWTGWMAVAEASPSGMSESLDGRVGYSIESKRLSGLAVAEASSKWSTWIV